MTIQKIIILALLILFTINSKANAADSPWPEIRKQRITQLLPNALKAANVDAWLIVCRENNNDPLADHIGCENAGSPAAYLFYFNKGTFHSVAYSPSSEAKALDELNIHEKVISVPRSVSALKYAAEFIKKQPFERIAINVSDLNAQADGLSHSQYKQLASLLGAKHTAKLVSSEEVVYQWLSIKLPAEVEIMKEAAMLSATWQLEAYKTIVPGKTTDADVAKFLKAKMKARGVTDAWAADQNPNVNSGPDRGHSHSTNKVIMPGDVIQIDFGVKLYNRWVSDIQRFAYVLKEGETSAPANIQQYWVNARDSGFAAFNAMKPGVKGIDVDQAQTVLMNKYNSEPVPWSTGHPVGYVAHDTGPNLGGSRSAQVRPAAHRKLKEGMVFAFDGFFSWPLNNTEFKTISVEEMAVITKNGAEYLIPPQQNLVLVGNNE
ncbi:MULTISPECIES: M24 family metallopeptidase [unclassified Pseudoalteromonas]|uniref:M24 family metallopeptidase n=1 Tax=unclassified Pseudoalteromonas TaxID=194690 RepID=UPI0007308FA2|nr:MULTISPECIES: M24 family metallopeptidase [unclassified Pseudoalteromonas]KTD95679.1 peptidase M24 [Pseudoalteromonas sp. H71]TMN80627.1 peptidase M24 [Pseudoalteromonas sp. S410]TMN89786.1 peptidase M24 [Pseudoalteromonas sp. S408]TMN97397.1 peptidase M24 [Pseudoalteromonas sp. S407]TMO02406.1 peptidase M24 [Pseudoalteromonas sp. S409]